jgi:TAT (twin-arginine translocation) pathway signal sequence
MTEPLSRRSLLKAGGLVGAGLALGLVAPGTARAASFDELEATVDFARTSLDRFTIRAKFNGISQTLDPNTLRIRLEVENLNTGELATYDGPPTVLR